MKNRVLRIWCTVSAFVCAVLGMSVPALAASTLPATGDQRGNMMGIVIGVMIVAVVVVIILVAVSAKKKK